MRPLNLQYLELTTLFGVFICLTLFCFTRQDVLPYLVTTIIVGILYYFIEIPRWHIILGFLVFVSLVLFYIFNIKANLVWQITGFSFGSLFIGISLLLIFGIPITTLPKPTGKYQVGSAFFKDIVIEGQNRDQYLQIWYPVDSKVDVKQCTQRTLWQQLYEKESKHLKTLAFFTSFLRGIKTHAFHAAPLAPSQDKFPIILYQHGLVSFTSENTLLMEELASHGYVVVANSYQEHFKASKSDSLNFSQPISEKELLKLLKQAKTRIDVANLMRDYALSSEKMNYLVANRTKDARYILNNLATILHRKSNLKNIEKHIDFNKTGIIGYSLGGAVAIETSLGLSCTAGINLDGIHYGAGQKEHLAIPFLSFNKALTRGANDHLLKHTHHQFIDITIKDTEHIDFHDMTYLFPIFKWFKASGNVDAKALSNYRNRTILDFMNTHLKGLPLSLNENEEGLSIELKTTTFNDDLNP